MCDGFYQHYLREHAILTKYFQSINPNASAVSSCDGCRNFHCNSYNPNFYNPMNEHHIPPNQAGYSSDSISSECYTTTTYSSEYEVEEEGNSEHEEEDEEECEYELNVEAILAMRAAKEDLKSNKSSKSDSIVLVDSDKEEFEFIDLGSCSKRGAYELSRDVGNSINKSGDFRAHQKFMDYLYGEKSTTIGGLETAMGVNYDRLFDIHQPAPWPVLPVRL